VIAEISLSVAVCRPTRPRGTSHSTHWSRRDKPWEIPAALRSRRLTTMQPRTELSETRFALADPGNEYVILQPSETGGPFTITLTLDRYAGEWHNLASRETVPATTPTVADGNPIIVTAPFEVAGAAVVHLRRIGN
jgi:hypothetical protein